MSGWRPVLLRLAALALLVFNLLAIPQPAEAATYVVNTTDDTTLGTFCDETHCSLREAIQEADLVISKGGGNFDALEGEKDLGADISFMLLSKCIPYCHYFQTGMFQPILANFFAS